MLQVREEDRLSTEQVLEHPWMKTGLPQHVEKQSSEEAMEVEEEDVEASISIYRMLVNYLFGFSILFYSILFYSLIYMVL